MITDVSFCTGIAVISLMDSTMMLLSTTMWDVNRVIAYPDFYIKQCQFIANTDGTSILLSQTSNDEIMLTCMIGTKGDQKIHSRMLINMNNLDLFVVSANGRLLVNIHQCGNLFFYNLENHWNDLMVGKSKIVENKKRSCSDMDRSYQGKIDEKKVLDLQLKVKIEFDLVSSQNSFKFVKKIL